ncbi:MAG: hypothetical protein HYX76_15195 [Acidobacteria bacterium]|nr:hypothetical protein [Acidobacteriota bacterium]
MIKPALIACLIVIAGATVLAVPPAVQVVEAADAPVRLMDVRILEAGDGSGSVPPPVLLYAAANTTDRTLEQFIVTLFIYGPDGVRKGSQTAPSRRTLEPHATKYSTMVLDGMKVEPTDRLVAAVQEAQFAGSEEWWRHRLIEAADAKVKGGR